MFQAQEQLDRFERERQQSIIKKSEGLFKKKYSLMANQEQQNEIQTYLSSRYLFVYHMRNTECESYIALYNKIKSFYKSHGLPFESYWTSANYYGVMSQRKPHELNKYQIDNIPAVINTSTNEIYLLNDAYSFLNYYLSICSSHLGDRENNGGMSGGSVPTMHNRINSGFTRNLKQQNLNYKNPFEEMYRQQQVSAAPPSQQQPQQQPPPMQSAPMPTQQSTMPGGSGMIGQQAISNNPYNRRKSKGKLQEKFDVQGATKEEAWQNAKVRQQQLTGYCQSQAQMLKKGAK